MKEHVICPICAEKATVHRTGRGGYIKCDGPNGCGHYAPLSKANLERLNVTASPQPEPEPAPSPEPKKNGEGKSLYERIRDGEF